MTGTAQRRCWNDFLCGSFSPVQFFTLQLFCMLLLFRVAHTTYIVKKKGRLINKINITEGEIKGDGRKRGRVRGKKQQQKKKPSP